ncbi:MAG: transposase [Hyphomicrobiales bacterium]|nr:transposase [Hyphomicrobiales bacterium]
MQRKKFSCEFKLEAVDLVRERGVSIAQAAHDHEINRKMLRR